jgi:hypothetical protein
MNKNVENFNETQKPKLGISVVMCCAFCGKEINKNELTYTEDAESSHIKCLAEFEKHWDDRQEALDLMGY